MINIKILKRLLKMLRIKNFFRIDSRHKKLSIINLSRIIRINDSH